MSRPVVYATLAPSPVASKKLRATFYDAGMAVVAHTDFGATGYSDYTIHRDAERRARYAARHRATEDWEAFTTAGSLAWHVLWSRPTVQAAWRAYLRRFGLRSPPGV